MYVTWLLLEPAPRLHFSTGAGTEGTTPLTTPLPFPTYVFWFRRGGGSDEGGGEIGRHKISQITKWQSVGTPQVSASLLGLVTVFFLTRVRTVFSAEANRTSRAQMTNT
jgi:hypothetical protein